MNVILQLTPHDPLIARDGRPFGARQGNRMRSLTWPLPSVVAGSLRSALVKSNPNWDFTKKAPIEIMRCDVAGVFPAVGQELYLPAPLDAVAEPNPNGQSLKTVHRLAPGSTRDSESCDLPNCLRPVLLPDGVEDFKPAKLPTWWPVKQLKKWLLGKAVIPDHTFLMDPIAETRDHVCIDPQTGAAMESLIFTSTGLNLTHLPKFDIPASEPRNKRLMPISLSTRVTIAQGDCATAVEQINLLSSLGGERRLIHWQKVVSEPPDWKCPQEIREALKSKPLKPSGGIRMVLASPAIFKHGWLPGWLDNGTLQGKPPCGDGVELKLVAACVPRWKAVSGWAMQKHEPRAGESPAPVVPVNGPGPKAIRRMVPAGAVYFFELVSGNAEPLATNGWLKPVSDLPADRRDGFGLAVWGVW
jgi:CRISPR-associated protein Cmr3